MSYILDALKKAGQEREFGQVPDIDSLHELPPPRPSRRWPWVLVAALLLNALVVAGLWWREEGETTDGTTPTARPVEPVAQGAPDSVSMPPPVTSRLDPAARAKPAAPPPPVEVDSVAAPAAKPASPPPALARRPLRPLPLPDPPPAPLQAKELPVPAPLPSAALSLPPEAVQLRAPSPPPPPESEPAWKSLPRWPLVPENIRRQVKERLVLNVHVYNARPEDRFVLFNMKKYHEGEQIAEGLDLEEITREGVILAVPNGRFRLGSR